MNAGPCGAAGKRLTVVRRVPGSNPGSGMDVCLCLVILSLSYRLLVSCLLASRQTLANHSVPVCNKPNCVLCRSEPALNCRSLLTERLVALKLSQWANYDLSVLVQ